MTYDKLNPLVLAKIDNVVRMVQNKWILTLFERRKAAIATYGFIDKHGFAIDNEYTNYNHEELNNFSSEYLEKIMYDNIDNEDSHKSFPYDLELGLRSEVDDEINERTYNTIENVQLNRKGIKNKNLINNNAAINQPIQRNNQLNGVFRHLNSSWSKPDWDKAKRYADFTNPRKGGKGGVVFNSSETTLGRHCCLGGVGEQCDIFQEGQISEFSMYGAGISNYFKFLKWLCWLFICLSLISLPVLLLNFYGPEDVVSSGLTNIAQTTAGNLQNTIVNATLTVHIPGCDNYSYKSINCYFNKEDVGRMYCYIDIIFSVVVIIAFRWLRYFEKKEESDLIVHSTINASDYTVRY
jgi:hypothetical protein